MSGLDVDAIRARIEAATPGPWAVVLQPFNEAHVVPLIGGDTIAVSEMNEMDSDGDDAKFIAHSRDDVADLLDALETVAAERDEARAALGQIAAVLIQYEDADSNDVVIVHQKITRIIRSLAVLWGDPS